MCFRGLGLFVVFLGFNFLGGVVANANSSASELFTDLFYDSSPKLEIPADFIKNKLQDGVWKRPELGYAFQFRNHPDDPDRFIRLETLNLTLVIPANPIAQVPVQLGPRFSAEFIRPFDKENPLTALKKSVTTSPPYGPSKVPYSYENALKLKKEDYFSFTASLAFQIAPSTAHATGIDFVGNQAFIRYILSGDFKVEVYRLSESKVKVIASSLRSKTLGAGAKLRFVPDIEVFGFSLLDNLVNKKISADLIDWTLYEKNKGHLFSVSYIYDLSEEAGQKAYDALMDPRKWKKPTLQFNKKVAGKLNPIESSFWLADVSLSQELAETNTPGVVHVDNSQLGYEQTSKGIRFDVLLADKNKRRHFIEADYSYQPVSHLQPQNYRIANFKVEDDYQFLFNVAESKVSRETTLVFDSNASLQISNFHELHFLYRREDNKLKESSFQNEASMIIGEMRKMLPAELYGTDLNRLNEILNPAYTQKLDSWVQMEMTYSPLALGVVQQLSYDEISGVIDAFMDSAVPLIVSNKKNERFVYGNLELFPTIDNLKNTGDPKKFFNDSRIRRIKESLYLAFQRTNSFQQNENQWEIFKDLQSNLIFRDFGSAFLVRLLAYGAKKNPKLTLRDLVYFRARVKVKNENEKLIHIGNHMRSEATIALLTQKDRVMNRSYNTFHFIE